MKNLYELQNLIIDNQQQHLGNGALYTLKNAGKLVTLCHGQHVFKEEYLKLTKTEQQQLKIIGCAATQSSAVISHTSAACLWGLANTYHDEKVHFRVRTTKSSKNKDIKYHLYQGPLKVVEHSFLTITTVEDTIIDCAQILPFNQAVALADSALRQNKTTRKELEKVFNNLEKPRKKAAASKVIASCTHLSDSVGESLCRLALESIGMPPAVLQKKFSTFAGDYRADFYYPEWKLIIEFDGNIKYDGTFMEPAQAIKLEKKREELLKNLGLNIVRFNWQEIHEPWILRNKLSKYVRHFNNDIASTSQFLALPF